MVLDSTVVIGAERAGRNPSEMIEEIAALWGDTKVILSVITVLELAHGIARADSAQRRTTRERFVEELLNEIPVEHVAVPIAFSAGRLDGRLRAIGLQVALGDLLIGATALELGYAVLTHNVAISS